jgi:hypothetical protein
LFLHLANFYQFISQLVIIIFNQGFLHKLHSISQILL